MASGGKYGAQDVLSAYKAIYGTDLGSGGSGTGGQLDGARLAKDLAADKNAAYVGGTSIPIPGGGSIPLSQLMSMYQRGGGGAAAPADQAQAAGTTPSYLTAGSSPATGTGTTTTSGIANMATGVNANQTVSPDQARAFFVAHGGSAAVDDATAMQYFQQANPNFGMSGVDAQTAMQYYVAHGGSAQADPATAMAYYEAANPDKVQAGIANAALTPEQRALGQMTQIDPKSEALRQQLAGSYIDPSQAANPTAAQYKSYLDTLKQVDPEEYAQRQGLSTSMDSYLKSMQDQYALGSQLDPVTAHQVEQQTRAGQAARGNVYGTPQMVEEAMTTGQAGQALQQQRLQNLQTALGAQQGYLGAGLGLGDTAMNLYQQGLGNRSAAQQGALSYLSSGQTPYQAGAGYLSGAEQTAANAAQGGPVYNPTSLGANYGGTAAQAPQYGLDVGQQAQNWYNSLSAYSGAGTPTKNKGVSAATGALSGAMSGATAGSAAGPYGTVIGGVVGAAAGGLGGYYS